MSTITISKRKIEKQGGVVILPLREYQELSKRAVSTYYLKGKEAKELDRLVEKGLEDYHKGKCRTIKSLTDLE